MASETEARADEQMFGNLLRAGVIASAVVVLLGGGLYLARHAGERVDYHTFREERVPPELRHPAGIVEGCLQGQSQAVIAAGLLLLVATPIARVVFSVYLFVRHRDVIYVTVTLIVLTVLLFSLFSRSLAEL
jgi:uncharacterized membrane protein